MSEKTIKSRIIHKHDIESNWLLATNFTPKQGEIIVYDVDENYTYERIKVGDGSTNVNELPFITDAAGSTCIVQATSEDGEFYTATAPSITSLERGTSLIIVPNMSSATKGPMININDFGDRYIRRRLSTGATVDEGYTEAWINKNKPFRLMYDGAQWVVEGHNKPVAQDIYGEITATYDSNGDEIISTYARRPQVTTIELFSSAWIGTESPYSQEVAVNGAHEYSKIDLQPSALQVVDLQNQGVALMAENEDGVITVYAIGGIPNADYTMQALITEVAVI